MLGSLVRRVVSPMLGSLVRRVVSPMLGSLVRRVVSPMLGSLYGSVILNSGSAPFFRTHSSHFLNQAEKRRFGHFLVISVSDGCVPLSNV
jgi:hypothetical protein